MEFTEEQTSGRREKVTRLSLKILPKASEENSKDRFVFRSTSAQLSVTFSKI